MSLSGEAWVSTRNRGELLTAPGLLRSRDQSTPLISENPRQIRPEAERARFVDDLAKVKGRIG